MFFRESGCFFVRVGVFQEVSLFRGAEWVFF